MIWLSEYEGIVLYETYPSNLGTCGTKDVIVFGKG